MKSQYFLSILFVLPLMLVLNLQAQNVEFDKANFPNRSKELSEALKNIKKGDKFYESEYKMYLQAIEPYIEANKFNPNNALLNYKIGFCYINTIKKTNAIPYFKKALELDEDVALDIIYLLGQAYHLNSEFDKAIIKYKEYKKSLSPIESAELGKEVDKKIKECETGKELTSKPANVYIDNIGNIVNSTYQEYSPIVNADETMIIFTSRRPTTTGGGEDPLDYKFYEDIYITYKKDDKWASPKNHGKPLNSDFHDATVGLSPDGQTLLIYKGDNGGDIYQCELKGDKWSKPEKLNGDINTSNKESSASFSYDGRSIYFVSDRPGSFGGSDIYISKKDANDQWGTATNIGSTINSIYDEKGVFMHPDGKTLYFSSKGHNSMGGFDIYKSVYENGKWSKPENLGYPVNTPDDDVFFSVTASGKHGYYSSAKAGGIGDYDIYVVTFGFEKLLVNNTEDNLLANIDRPINIEPVVKVNTNQLTLLKGTVVDDKTSEPLEALIEIVNNKKNEIVSSFKSNSVTGKYLVTLPSGFNYGIAVKAKSYLFHSENINIASSTEYQEIEKNIRLKKVEAGSKIVLNNIFFDYGKSTLSSESTGELDRLVELMKDMPTLKIEIGGHTDNVSSAAFNIKLSKARAKSVVDYLISKGIEATRLTYQGYGFEQPIASNKTEEGRQLNRRTEFKVISK